MKGGILEMKNKKRVFCSGLAFYDKEDMEMLHKYALEGWIFREFKGLSYILHKEEPQDLIFSYDLRKVPPEEMDEYLATFESAGWHPIPSKDPNYHFFWAKNGTVPLHTDEDLQSEQYRQAANWSLKIFLFSVALLILAGFSQNYIPASFKWGYLAVTFIAMSLLACSAIAFIGTYVRTKKKRISFDMSFKSCVFIFVGGFLGLIVLMFVVPGGIKEATYPLFRIFYGLCGAFIGFGLVASIFKYPLYRDGKAK